MAIKQVANNGFPHSGGGSYGDPPELAARVAVLETKVSNIEESVKLLRSSVDAIATEMRAEFRELRRIHDRDFRITMGTIIVAGLAAIGAFAWIINFLMQISERLPPH